MSTLAATTRDPHGRLAVGAASSALSRRHTQLAVDELRAGLDEWIAPARVLSHSIFWLR